MTLSRFKPDVPKCWLFAASGVMWSAVGLVMCATGAGWLVGEGVVRALGFELAGLALAAVCWPLLLFAGGSAASPEKTSDACGSCRIEVVFLPSRPGKAI